MLLATRATTTPGLDLGKHRPQRLLGSLLTGARSTGDAQGSEFRAIMLLLQAMAQTIITITALAMNALVLERVDECLARGMRALVRVIHRRFLVIVIVVRPG